MTTFQLLHFVVRNLTFTLTDTGVMVVCYSNNPCHLWKRHTTIEPQKHIIPRVVRGADVGSYIDHCFVAYQDQEQQESGDTFTHTFIQEPWPNCQTRWFYFWGTVSGQLSPSASAIFWYHRQGAPLKIKIYSAQGHFNQTVDGYCGRSNPYESWANQHDGPGNMAEWAGRAAHVLISIYNAPGTFYQLCRTKATFDLSVIPPGSTILSASYYMLTFNLFNTWSDPMGLGLSLAPAPPYDNVVYADYQLYPSTLISNVLPWGSIPNFAFCHLDILPAYLSLLIPGNKFSIGVREALHDIPDIEPIFKQWAHFQVQMRTVDWIYPSERPYLEVTYQ